jgi:hypothetical protein
VLDVASGAGAAPEGGPDPVIYPWDGQADVPAAFTGVDVTELCPEDKDAVVGTAVTASWRDGVVVTDFEARVSKEGAAEIPARIYEPGSPRAGVPRNTAIVLPRDALEPGTKYRVSLRAAVGGRPWERNLTFKTRAR